MKRERRIPITATGTGDPDHPRASMVAIVPDGAEPTEGGALHVLSRSEANELLRAWRRAGRPCRNRSPEPILCAITWALIEQLRTSLEAPEGGP